MARVPRADGANPSGTPFHHGYLDAAGRGTTGADECASISSAIALPGLVLIAVVAYVLGPGPGLLAGLIGGLTWARYTPLILTDLLALSMWGYLVGAFLHQNYRGDIFTFLRQPLVAIVLSSFVTVLLLSLSRLASSRLSMAPGSSTSSLSCGETSSLWLFCGGLGAMFQAVTLNPRWRLQQRGDVPSFYSRSLSAQFMVFSVPLVILSMLFSVLAVTNRSVSLAREQSLQEMRRSAVTAGKGIQQFYITGRNLIEAFAKEPQLLSADPQAQVETLNIALRVVPFFQQLLLVRETGGEFVVVSASSLATVDAQLTADELAALETLRVLGVGIEETRITQRQIRGGEAANAYSVIGTVYPEDVQEPLDPEWFLIGRALFDTHPDIQAALAALQKTRSADDGALSYEYKGFVVDDSGWIVAHPDPGQLNTVRTLDSAASEAITGDGTGTLFETLTQEGEHVLAYVHQVETLSAEGRPGIALCDGAGRGQEDGRLAVDRSDHVWTAPQYRHPGVVVAHHAPAQLAGPGREPDLQRRPQG